VLGAGAIGAEIALQCAMCGYRVSLFDPNAQALRAARARIEAHAFRLSGRYTPEPAKTILARLFCGSDLEEAAGAADIAIECAPEDIEVKRRLFAELGALAPPHAIFATNSSSIAPSAFADVSGRPEQFLALHFHKTVWISNLVEVMGHARTRADVVAKTTQFAKSLRQTTIVIGKETPSYVFNTMLQAYLGAALGLWCDGVASFEDIDRAWMIAERAPHGPFGVMDFVGIDIVAASMLARTDLSEDRRAALVLKRLDREFLVKGRLGVKTGAGFYNYPSPAYKDAGFIASPHGLLLDAGRHEPLDNFGEEPDFE
jgi:3-hydroxybutyryl-CoA dehydrogenase